MNQVNDGSVQLSSSLHCCTSACSSIRSKDDAGPLGKRQGKDVTAGTASFAMRGSSVPAVRQICTTDSARRMISIFLEILKKKIWLYLSCGLSVQEVTGTTSVL